MGYGVNRATKKRTTRRKVRRQSSGRAPAAGRRKKAATSTKRATSARRAPKKRAPKSSRRRTAKKRTSQRSTSTKRARTYTRYDPETGAKVKVTADSYEYANWLSRKPSKKRVQRAALLSSPIATLGTIGATAGRKAIERAGETAAKTTLRAARNFGLAEAGLTAAGLTAAATSAAILAAGYVVMDRVAKAGTVAVGDKLNAISTRFVETQRQLIQAFGVTTWQGVPADVRDKALRAYKQAITTTSAQAQGRANITAKVEGSYK